MKNFLPVCLSLFLLFSCEEQFNNIQSEIPQKILDQSVIQFNGEIIATGSAEIDNINLWNVEIENASGSVVNFYWQKKNKLLFRIEGIKGPFNYELKPSVGVLNFSSAKFIAYESYLDETLISWSLSRNNFKNAVWVYEFYLAGADESIMLDAVSGDKI